MNQENLYVPLSQDEKTERSIQLLIDAESGEIVEADEILDCGVDEKILIDMRHALKLAQRSGQYKYLCAFCEQGVQLVCRRSSSGKNIFFFSHFYKSDDCPVKTTTTQNPIEILKNQQNAFKESKMHKDMISHIGECLALDSSFSKCSLYPDTYIKDTSVSVDFRRPDIVSYYSRDGKDAVPLIIELHLYTSLLSIILERDTFYREHKMNLLWIFPEFSPLNQRIGQKDIYYRNKRNVFVFDEDAYESSLKNKTLMLKCWWPIPVENDGKIVNEWHHKFISIRDLKFDSETYEVYYHDSDKDFYENSDSELQSKINKWEEAIRVRTSHLKDSLEEKAKRVASQKEKLDRAEQIRRFRELLSMAERREITPEAYCDDAAHLYGFRLGEFILVKPRFTKIGSWVDGIIPVKQAHWGAINYAGAKIIPFQYDIIGEFKDGVAVAEKDGKDGIIDAKGNIVVPFEYDWIGGFEDGVARAKKDGKYGLIDWDGNEIVTNEVELENGLVKGEKFGLWGCVDSDGNIVIPYEYEEIGEFRDGVAVVKKNGKCGLIDAKGTIIALFEYEGIGEFGDGVANVKKNGKYALIDAKGNIIAPFEYDGIGKFRDGVANVKKNGKYALIDAKGNIIAPFEYDGIGKFRDGVAVIKKGWRYGLIDVNGKVIVPFEYELIGKFRDGVAVVKKNGKYGLINAVGNIIVPFEYDGIGEFKYGVAVVKKDGRYCLIDAVIKRVWRYGLIDTTGDIVVPLEYDKIEEFKDGVAIARKNGKCGCIDNKGNIVVPFEYDFISDFYENVALSQKENLFFVIEKANMSIRPLRLGDSFKGVVTNKKGYGLFVRICGSVTGLLHISNLKRFKLSLDDYKCGDTINVKIVTLDVNNRLSFAPYFPDSVYSGVVSDIKKYGVFVKVEHLGIGLIHKSELLKIGKSLDSFTLESAVNVKVLSQGKNRISFTLVE